MILLEWRIRRLRKQNAEIEGRIAGYRAATEAHRSQLERWQANQAEATALRNSESITRCVSPFGNWPCGAEMRQGDYRCHCCGSPNPSFVRRAVEFAAYGDA